MVFNNNEDLFTKYKVTLTLKKFRIQCRSYQESFDRYLILEKCTIVNFQSRSSYFKFFVLCKPDFETCVAMVR